ncbi:arginase [Clostridium sp. USBA 49]|jgi:arginase|uniref:arginase n=1 Tax=Clostridium sp. USBA 49 TaxID=1881060 RepID=UPI00099A2141|nr:arginase [Clostridium sp. USBA 49]SKA73298.1 arginase [Clostridium sp. USBA 49]
MDVAIIGVPIFYGADKHGPEYGPDKLREKKVVEIIGRHNHRVFDFGNLFIPNVKECNKFFSHPNMKYLDPIIQVNNNLAHIVYSSIKGNSFPFVIGGDHSLGLGSVAGSSRAYNNSAVVWIDAHGDINTQETSESGNIHGMSLAKAMGLGYKDLVDVYYKGPKVKNENVFIIGARDLDKGEYELIKKENLHVYTAKRIHEYGIEHVVNEVIKDIKSRNISSIHLSFDLDFIDAKFVPGTGTPVSNGMSIDETKALLKMFAKSNLVKSMDFVELNPLLDKNDITSNIAINLIDWTFEYLN